MRKKTTTIKNGRVHREKCNSCGQLLPRPKIPKLDTPDTRKMLRIMKKNNLNQASLGRAIGISQATVQGWFSPLRNLRGKIKPMYFEILKSKGLA